MTTNPYRYGVTEESVSARGFVSGTIHDLVTSKERCNLDAARRNKNLKKRRARDVERLIKTGNFTLCRHCCK